MGNFDWADQNEMATLSLSAVHETAIQHTVLHLVNHSTKQNQIIRLFSRQTNLHRLVITQLCATTTTISQMAADSKRQLKDVKNCMHAVPVLPRASLANIQHLNAKNDTAGTM